MPQGKKTLSPGEKAKAVPKSLKLAVAAYCYHNCFGEHAPNSHTTKMHIRDCTDETCHLWPFRGWQMITEGNCGPRREFTSPPQKTGVD